MKLAKLPVLAMLIAISISQSACVYRLSLQQGNIAELEDVEQVKIGMTPSQVKFLLGSPLIDDPFNDDRWDYVYQTTIGHNKPTTRQFLTVYFEDGKVARLERKDPPPKEPDAPTSASAE